MLDSMLPPSIPRRPKKQSQAGSTNDLESLDRFDTESDNEQSLESLKSEDLSDKIPVIPKRPDRSKSLSKSPNLPVIPKRPQKSVTNGVDASSSLDSSDVDETERKKSIFETSINSEKHSDDAIEQSKSSDPNFEDEYITELDNSKGEKTPVNTNTKNIIKEDIANDNSMRSFDDGLKAVLQERDDNVLPDLTHNKSNVHTTSENDRKSNLAEDANLDLNREETSESEDKMIDKLPTESNEEKYNEVENHSDSNEDSEKKVSKDQEVSQMSKLIGENPSDDKYTGSFPHIPRRPIKSKAPTKESNSKLVEGDASESPNPNDRKQLLIESSSEDTKSSSSLNEASQKTETLHPEKLNTKPKAPPKPKKLSSKIAAFQQMFNQENPIPKNSESNKLPSSQDLEVKSPDNKDVPSRLSTDKIKFAQSLQGMMGKGVAMPGMVNPNFQQKIDTEEDFSSNKEVKVQSVKKGIAKGPRGKKLPKSLKNPVNVEIAPRFSSFVLTIWELDFQSSNKQADDIAVNNLTETKNLENTKEVLKSWNGFEDIMDSKALSSSICPEQSEKDLSTLRPAHDDVYQEIYEPTTNEHERKNLEDSGGISDEKLSDKVEHDEMVSYSVKLKDLDLDINKQDILENKDSNLIESEEH